MDQLVHVGRCHLAGPLGFSVSRWLPQEHQAHGRGVDGRVQAVLLRRPARSPGEAFWQVRILPLLPLPCLCPACAAVGAHRDAPCCGNPPALFL